MIQTYYTKRGKKTVDRFCTNEISIAAYLMGAKDIRLISAGKDSLYGTDDDICNFVKK